MRVFVVSVCVIVALGFLTGCGGGKGIVGVNDGSVSAEFSAAKLARKPSGKKQVPPPTIITPSISPTSFDFFGSGNGENPLHVQANVTAKKKKDILTVAAVITRQSDSQTFTVPMTKVKGKTFAGNFNVPSNPSGNTQTYTVVIQATDNRPDPGRPATAQAGTFTVKGVFKPPGPPGS